MRYNTTRIYGHTAALYMPQRMNDDKKHKHKYQFMVPNEPTQSFLVIIK